jgi:hypothetical protein
LKSYKLFRTQQISKNTKPKNRKSIEKYINSHILELDTIFHSYNSKIKFNFNTADSLFIIYQAPVESPFNSDIIIWSGKDTISYRQQFERSSNGKSKRIVVYMPFRFAVEFIPGYIEVTERDSLITLASKKDFETAAHLSDNQKVIDESSTSIFVAHRKAGIYIIEACHIDPFYLPTTYRKK